MTDHGKAATEDNKVTTDDIHPLSHLGQMTHNRGHTKYES
jgi:hypothetical protein